MNVQFLRSIDGIINLVQVILGFIILFTISFIWSEGSVAIQIVYYGLGWQTPINFFFLLTWLFALGILISNIMGKSVYETFGKQKMLIAYGICLLLLLICAALESWYSTFIFNYPIYHARFIAACIMNWLLVVSYIALIAITAIFL